MKQVVYPNSPTSMTLLVWTEYQMQYF